MLSTLIPCLVVALILLGIFLLARVKLERIYQPRTYLGVFTKEYVDTWATTHELQRLTFP